MIPLQGNLSDISRLRKENDFQSERRNEVREFWKSGYDMAELKTSGKVALDTEVKNYKKAARQLSQELCLYDNNKSISFHIRQGSIIAVKERPAGTTWTRW